MTRLKLTSDRRLVRLPFGLRAGWERLETFTKDEEMKNRYDKKNNKYGMLIISLLVVFLSIFGCGANYGRLSFNRDVKRQFETYEVLPDHRYYYSGSIARPRAVIGIQASYTLAPGLWMPVDLTAEQLKGWVDYYGPAKIYGQENNGFDILAPDGQKIGVWYAVINWKDYAVVRMVGDRVVSISAPIEAKDEVKFLAIFPEDGGPSPAKFPDD